MIRDQFTRRPDNRAGDIKPIWPIDPPPKCGLDWWGITGIAICCASAVGVAFLVAAVASWLG